MRQSKMFEIIYRDRCELGFNLVIYFGKGWFREISITLGCLEFRLDRTSAFGFLFVDNYR